MKLSFNHEVSNLLTQVVCLDEELKFYGYLCRELKLLNIQENNTSR